MRKNMVTRTITTTKAEVLCVNTEEKTTVSKEFILPRTYKDDKAMLKQIERANTDTAIKPIHIVKSEVVETLYGMDEQDFIANATVMPPRSVKVDDTPKPDKGKKHDTGKSNT